MDQLTNYLFIAAVLFSLGVFGVMTRRNGIAVLMGVELILNSANLKNADLTNANLKNADLGGADLTNANLKKAVIQNSYFKNAKLDGVMMDETDTDSCFKQDLLNKIICKIN